jgi:hypothetical protein
MATATLQELLQPQFILNLISRVRPGWGPLGKWLGFLPKLYNPETGLEGPATIAGPSTLNGTIRNVTYRIFNVTRTVPTLRAPGTGPNTVVQNPMAAVTVACGRFHDKIPLSYEMLNNLSPMVGPNSQIDNLGQSYIKQQTNFLAQKYAKGIELMAAGMMRDSLYVIQSGETWLPSFTAPTGTQVGFQISFQIPAGNKNQLNMLGTGNIINESWANVGAPIVSDIMRIQAAFAQLSDYALTDVWINGTMWINIINNTQVRNLGGTANTPFASFDYTPDVGPDGQPTGEMVAVLRGLPWLRWHMTNSVLSLGSDLDISYSYSTGTATKLIPDTMCIFSCAPSPEIAQLYCCGEPVVENPGMPAVLRSGWYFWHEYTTQPSGIDLISLLNCIPALYNPLVFAPASCVF